MLAHAARKRPLVRGERLEAWKDIEGYEGLYQVSNRGRVRSLDRVEYINNKVGGITRRVRKGKILKPCFDGKKNYVHVNLSVDNESHTVNIHRLVALAFLPNPCNYREINHKDEDKTNNNVDNLEWCDHSYNNTYGSKFQSTLGVKNPQAKLTEVDVLEIRKRRNQGELLRVLANEFGVCESRISAIASGRSWGWLK